MKISISFLLGLLCLTFALPNQAQDAPAAAEPGTISGTLTDSATGKPVALATVQLLHHNIDYGLNRTFSDASGRFILTNLPSGTYDLALIGRGYRSKTIVQITITATTPAYQTDTLRLSSAGHPWPEIKAEERTNLHSGISGVQLSQTVETFNSNDRGLAETEVPFLTLDSAGNLRLRQFSDVRLLSVPQLQPTQSLLLVPAPQ